MMKQRNKNKHVQNTFSREKRASASTRGGPQFTPAPIPKENIWVKRAAQHRSAGNNDSRPGPTQVEAQVATQVAAAGGQRPQMEERTEFAGNPKIINFSEFTSEINNLNNLINVNAMLKAIKDLNAQLLTCNNEIEKFTTFYTFTQNLNKYGL